MKDIKKAILCMTVFSAAIILSGCNAFKTAVDQVKNEIKNELSSFNTNTHVPSSLETSKKLIDILNSENSSDMKEMFCERSQELDDIDKQIQAVFSFIDGDITSFDENINDSMEKHVSFGTKKMEKRGYAIDDAVTDNGKSYTIYVTENLVYLNDPKRVGIMEISIRNNDDDSEVSIGYLWNDFHSEGRRIAHDSSKTLGEQNDKEFANLFCDFIKSSPNFNDGISNAMAFFDGMPYFGKIPGGLFEYDGDHDIDVTVKEEEIVKNGEAVCISLKIYCENIETDTGRIFSSEIEAYIQNNDNPELVGITGFKLLDENKNSITIENNTSD